MHIPEKRWLDLETQRMWVLSPYPAPGLGNLSGARGLVHEECQASMRKTFTGEPLLASSLSCWTPLHRKSMFKTEIFGQQPESRVQEPVEGAS